MAEKLRRLRSENRKLRRENEYLRHRAEQLGDRTAAHGNEDAVMRDAVRNLSVSRSRTYFGYLMLSLKSSRTFRVYDKTSFAVRNLFFASKLWRIITGVATFLGIGAQVILTLRTAALCAVRTKKEARERIFCGHGGGFFKGRRRDHRFTLARLLRLFRRACRGTEYVSCSYQLLFFTGEAVRPCGTGARGQNYLKGGAVGGRICLWQKRFG